MAAIRTQQSPLLQSAGPHSTSGSNNSSGSSSANKIIYSPPASPAASISSYNSPAPSSAPAPAPSTPGVDNGSSSPASGVTNEATSSTALLASSSGGAGAASNTSTVATALSSPPMSHHHHVVSMPCTPQKCQPDANVLQRIREKLRTPGGACELHSLHLERAGEAPVNVIKHRYLISTQPCPVSAAAAAKTPASYRHLIDLTGSNLKCTDVFTEEQFLCKIINEPLGKVQRAYFQLRQEGESSHSSIYGHALIRGVHDIVPFSKYRTYVIIAASDGKTAGSEGVYEDLHTYIRNKRRLCESEARALFHQICETVQVCHRNGIILRDLKLKRFYFIDEARTRLQYESLEGSMILDDPNDDTLSDKIGCPLYTAPELLCPNPTYHGKPADMWSLGVILYTMLVGQYPFYEKGNCNLITIIRHGHVQIPMGLSKSVRWLLLLLLRKNHEERVQAEHIFLSPWLKEQRPYYMYIPVDVEISDDEDDDEVAAVLSADCRTESMPSALVAADCDTEVYAFAEPLDYSTRSALQLGSVMPYDADGDVEMG